MPAQTHAAVQGDSPTPLHPYLHAPATHAHSIQHLTNEVLATAHLLQQQIRTLECFAHATEEREATLVQQRAKLQELLRLVTQMETAEIRATASLRATLGRVRSGRSFAALRLASPGVGVGVGASPGVSPCPGLGESSSIVPPSPLPLPLGGGSGGGGGGGGEGDADPVDNPDPERASQGKGTEPEEFEGSGGEQRVGQSGEGEGTDGASKQAGSSVGDGVGSGVEDTSQPLPKFASLRVKAEDKGCVLDDSKEGRGAPQEDVGGQLPQADAVVTPGASEPRVMDRDHGGKDGQAGADTEHGAGRVDDLKGAGDGRGETYHRLDRPPSSALDGITEPQGAPASSKQGDEPTAMKNAAVGSDGSWRARKRMPERNAKQQIKGASTEKESKQEAKGKGGQGDIDGQAGGEQKRAGRRTPSPKKAQVPGDRVQPSPPKKTGKAKGGVGRRS